ncbi:MAG: Ankyrin [Chthonomonadaceae bacterium]|nr:Ankyrin [Chthonomonadaceae bacterium]
MYRRRAALFTLLLMAGLAAILGVAVWREVRQTQLNQALITAVRHRDAPTVVTLLKGGADANARESDAIRLSLWSLLRNRLAGKTTPTSHAATALAIACGYSVEAEANSPQQLAIVAALLAKGADVNGKDPDGDPVIILPIRWENASCVQMLLNAGADPNAADAKGTPALLAAVGGYNPCVSQKLPNGQTIVEMWIGHRVLDAAQWKAEYIILKDLLNRGAKIEASCYGGGTALHWVSKDDYVEAVRLLVARGTNVNARDDDGDTPLIEAGGCGSSGTVRFLLAHGADMEARNNNGQTALLETAEYGYPEIIEMLLTHGANPAAKDNKGRGVLKIVRQGFDDTATYRLLKHAGARE